MSTDKPREDESKPLGRPSLGLCHMQKGKKNLKRVKNNSRALGSVFDGCLDAPLLFP